MNSAEQAALTFCSALFAGTDESLADHQATVVTFPGPSVRWVQGLDPAAIASAVRDADSRGSDGAAVYLSMSPLDPQAEHYATGEDGERRKRRGDLADTSALLGVWADLDWASPAHANAKRLPDDEAAIRRIVDAVHLAPTLLWRSGHGLQAFWGLTEPIVFGETDDPAAARAAAGELVRNWQLTLAFHAHRLGRWQIDMTADLTRVLRPAGTTNRKIPGDARRVEIIAHHPTTRYEAADLEVAMAPRRVLEKFASMSSIPADAPIKDVDQVAIWDMVNSEEYRERRYVPEWLMIMVENGDFRADSRMVKVFTGGHDGGESETDASLARHIAMLDLDPADAVEIIMCRHLRTGHKLDKVDPRKRKDGGYIVLTVGKAFEEERRKRVAKQARVSQGDAAVAALSGQETAAGPAWDELPDPGLSPVPEPEHRPVVGAGIDPVEAADTLGSAVVAQLADDVHAVHDPPPPEPEPGPGEQPGTDGDEDDGSDGLDDVPADAPPAGAAQDHAAGTPRDEPDDEPAGEPGPEESPEPDETGPGTGEPEQDPEPDETPTAERPAVVPSVTGRGRGAWGSRTRAQHDELTALSHDLLGDRTAERVAIWRCQTRGRGITAQRRVVMRFDRSYAWPVAPPVGYVPGLPYATGWWPAATFNTYGGWRTVLQQEVLLLVQPMKPEDFLARYGRSLVLLWEADDSGGSLENITRDALLSYLSEYPLLPEWRDASSQGMPYIAQSEPRWTLDSPFTVLVRWAEYGAHVRSRFGVNTTPQTLTEMAELAGARAARTLTQDGRWRSIRREYLTDAEWSAVLLQAQVAAQQREERHGMHVMPGGLYSDPSADARADSPEHRRQR